jgi:hypothetical protein
VISVTGVEAALAGNTPTHSITVVATIPVSAAAVCLRRLFLKFIDFFSPRACTG